MMSLVRMAQVVPILVTYCYKDLCVHSLCSYSHSIPYTNLDQRFRSFCILRVLLQLPLRNSDVVKVVCAFRPRLPLMRVVGSRHIPRSHATVPPHLYFLILDELLRPFRRDDFFVFEHEQGRIAGVVSIQVFECTAGGLRIEKVDCVAVRGKNMVEARFTYLLG